MDEPRALERWTDSRGITSCAGTIAIGAAVTIRAAGATPAGTVARNCHCDPPQVLFKNLFIAVQSAQLFPDSKTFADAVPKSAPAQILSRFDAAKPVSREALQAFVAENFTLPAQLSGTELPVAEHVSITRHIDLLWDQLTRTTTSAPPYSSLLPLPEPYVVPGGRFRELYYWDSYFTMLGLVESGRHDLVEHMVRDFASLIDTYGHVPNGTRTYYLSRSQPPFFYAMVGLLSSDDPCGFVLRVICRNCGANTRSGCKARKGWAEARRIAGSSLCPMAPCSTAIGTMRDTPRDESYREDTALAQRERPHSETVYRDVRAAAESGWDFSSRWFADGKTLETIDTTEIIPIDLNSLLFGLEQAIGAGCARAHDAACATEFAHRAAARRAAVNRYLWDSAIGVFHDYRWVKREQVPRLSAATLYPLFAALASKVKRPPSPRRFRAICSRPAALSPRRWSRGSSGTRPMAGRRCSGSGFRAYVTTPSPPWPTAWPAAGSSASIVFMRRAASWWRNTTS